MKLIVGLGNPGSEHEKNRHNIGFMCLDEIADFYNFPEFKSKHQGLISQSIIDGIKIILLKPTTYMNLSGQSVQAVCKFYKINIEDIIVIYDDIDINPGQIKAKKSGGHGGHNGLRDINSHMGPDYWRIRIGVGHPGDKNRVSGFVLSNFGKTEWSLVEPNIYEVARNLPYMLNNESGRFLNEIALNKR